MKTIGLIGGMSWESTAVYYRRINDMVKEKLGGLHSANILVHSLDFEPIAQLQHDENWAELSRQLIQSAVNLEKAGAQCIALATNTMHAVAPQIEEAINVPFIHIADATGNAIQHCNIYRVALLGTRFTMSHDFYTEYLTKKFGTTVLIPDKAHQEIVHDVIYNELCQGQVTETAKNKVLNIILSIVQGHGAQGVILGCTELPLLITPHDVPCPLLDTTALHCQALVNFSLSDSKISTHG